MSKKLITVTFCMMIAFFSVFAEFDPCKFNFGTDWDYVSSNPSSEVAKNVDYITMWLVDASYNPNWQGSMISFCKSRNITPVFYSYIIAKASALGDADVGGKLRTQGAKYIRNNWSTITSRYENFATGIATNFGTDKACIWLMEPDYYQYSESSQGADKLSYSELSSKMSELIAIVKKHLPNALISVDITPWSEDQGQTSAYYSAMKMSNFDFANTSGGRTSGDNSLIRTENKMTWSGAANATGKGIIADDGYGASGSGTFHASEWDNVNTLKDRIRDGVIAITQKAPNSSWAATMTSLRTALANEKVKSCNGTPIPTKYSLSVTAGAGGTITKTPDSSSYKSGTTVTLTAVPSTGYAFDKWSGDVSGTTATVTVTMTSNKTATASFKKVDDGTFTLDIKTVGSGTVYKSPDKTSYTPGTQVTLTAQPVNGLSIFDSWSGGGLSGNNKTATITINTNTSITATFKDTAKVDTIKIEAENFTQKNGSNIKTETSNGITSIGYIESGNSTSYQVSIQNAGKYIFMFRVNSGIASPSFSVSVDGTNRGFIAFSGTVDDWNTFHVEKLSSNIDLSAGSHTIQLNYSSALNVDWLGLVPIIQPAPVNHTLEKAYTPGEIVAVKTVQGFTISLPQEHGFTLYELFNLNGKLFNKSSIANGQRILSVSNCRNDIMILKLHGKSDMAATIVVR